MIFEAELPWGGVTGLSSERCAKGCQELLGRTSSQCGINKYAQGQPRGQSPAPQVPVMGQEEQEVAGKYDKQAEVMPSSAAQWLNLEPADLGTFLHPLPL